MRRDKIMDDRATRDSRVRQLLLGGDTEPDPRFSLANERTFLAWIRTALAIIAAAVATDAVMADAWPNGIRRAIVVLLLVTGTAISAGAGLRWLAVERALRSGRPLPLSPLAPLLALVVFLGAAGALWLTMWHG
jgi:putative membrane protein